MKNLFKLVSIFVFCTINCDGQNSYKGKVNLAGSLIVKMGFDDKHYLICEANPLLYNIELLNRLKGNNGFYTLDEIAKQRKGKLIFAMNAGMFEKDLTPVGLFISDGKISKMINKGSGIGNFYLKPNGVFVIDNSNHAYVKTTESFIENNTLAKIATQSGPMLVINGNINSVFGENSSNINIRNGIGVNVKGNIVLVISEEKVNFYEMAKLFKEALHCDNALYLDGFVSQYYAPELDKLIKPGVKLGTFITVSKK